jgi:hypothetical protein
MLIEGNGHFVRHGLILSNVCAMSLSFTGPVVFMALDRLPTGFFSSLSGFLSKVCFVVKMQLNGAVILQSYDEISVHWRLLSRISNYKRADLSALYDPDYYGTDIRD